MPTRLPYRATTASGDVREIAFPLHPETGSTVRVSQMLTAVLGTLDGEVKIDPSTSNGDVLQALAMAIAVRSAMIEAPKTTTDKLTADLVATALDALGRAAVGRARAGRA